MANIPKSWADVTHKQYYNLICTPTLSFVPLAEQLRDVLLWVSDFTEEEIYALDLVRLAEIANQITWIFEPMQPSAAREFTHENIEYSYASFFNKPLIKLILNQTQKYDSEQIANEVAANDFSSIPKILALWATEKGEQGFDMGKVSAREKAFETAGVNILAGFYNFYVSQLVKIRENFKELFKDTYLKGSENFKHILDRYGWEISVSDLANADITKYDGVRLTPIFDALTQLEIRKLTAIAHENIDRQR